MDYNELKRAYEYQIKKLHSVNTAVKSLEEQNEVLHVENRILEARNTQLIARLEVQDRITHQTLEQANKQNTEYLAEINRLRAERDADNG